MRKPDLVFPTLVKNLLSTGVIGLVMAALIAAVMSHVSGAVNSCATIATIDLYLPYINKQADDAKAVRFGRLFAGLVVLLGIFWASVLTRHSDKPIFIYLMDAYGYFTPGIATMFLMGILWKRTTHAGAMTAGLLTIPLSVGLQQAFPDMPFANRTGIVFWICMAACALCKFGHASQAGFGISRADLEQGELETSSPMSGNDTQDSVTRCIGGSSLTR